MKQFLALAVGVLAAATLAGAALAGNDGKVTLGPSGYEPNGKSTLVVAGPANVVLQSEDHVVICHAIGGPKGTTFNQIAPSASGVVAGHGLHEGDRDIIPPFVYESAKGNKDASLASGNNWSAATAAIYANGCTPAAQTTPTTPSPQDVCPNIEGLQTALPTGLTKDASGNCVATTTTVVQSAPPAQTVVVEKVVVENVVVHVSIKAKKVIKKAKKVKGVKKVKAKKHKAKKAKKHAKKARIQVKGVRKAFDPGVLPHTR